jgi:hypothetical protein
MIPQDGTLVGVAVLGVIFTTCRHDGIIILWRGFSNRSPLGGGGRSALASSRRQPQPTSITPDIARHTAPRAPSAAKAG